MEFVHVELKRDAWAVPELHVKNVNEAVFAVQKMIDKLDRELVICIHIAMSGRVINASVCSMGTMTHALLSPAEVLRTALLSGAHGLIIVHNHPSGNGSPSKEDLQSAKNLSTMCDLMGLRLIDFIVIGFGEIHSVRGQEEEWLQPCRDWMEADLVSEKKEDQR